MKLLVAMAQLFVPYYNNNYIGMANQPKQSKREMGTQELKKKVLELQATVQRHTEEIKELQSKLKSHDEQL